MKSKKNDKDRYERLVLEQKLGVHKHLNDLKSNGKDPNILYKKWSDGEVLVNRKMITKDKKNDAVVSRHELKIVDYPLDAVLEINGIKYSYVLLQAFGSEELLSTNKPIMIVKRDNKYITIKELKEDDLRKLLDEKSKED